MIPSDADLLRGLAPIVLRTLLARGADFDRAEDAVQEALIRAASRWPSERPVEPERWLITVAWRAFLDLARADKARRAREDRFDADRSTAPVSGLDDSLALYIRCAHPSLTRSSAVALTLRAIGGLTTKQIADAYLVPESTMAQRISRAKRTLITVGFDEAGDLGAVMHTLYLVFNEGYGGAVDLSAEAVRLTRQLSAMVDEPEVRGLLSLMLLHHARRAARFDVDGRLIPLSAQDRSVWDRQAIADGVAILQRALALDRLGPYQAQAAIAALHADAHQVEDTDWVQIVEWYDELVGFSDHPVAMLNRAVAVGEAFGPAAGLAALAEVDRSVPRWAAVAGHLHEKRGDLATAGSWYVLAAHEAPSVAEREHQMRQASRVNAASRGQAGRS